MNRARDLFQILGRGAAKNSRRERGDNLARVDDRAHANPIPRSAIEHGNNRVLRHIDKTARQITRIRGLQAVSARPFRAPCVELKYSSTVSPSLKFEMIGLSMISPDGFRHQSAHRGELL